jgi:hypothetical protein
MIARGQTQQRHRQALAAIIGRQGVVKRGWAMLLHRGASLPFGTASRSAVVAATSNASSGRVAAHSQQMPHTEAAGGFGTAGTLNNSQPTRCLSHIRPLHAMHDFIRRGRASSQLRAALRRIGTSSG